MPNCDDCIRFFDKPSCEKGLSPLNCPDYQEVKFKLTEQGEAMAYEVVGGLDVANVVAALSHLLSTKGNFFGTKSKEEFDFKSWCDFVTFARAMKVGQTWENLVISCEKLLEKETSYFERMPHFRSPIDEA